MQAKRQRIHWIDVAKGVLITLVVMTHVPGLTGKYLGPSLLDHFYGLTRFYSCFFMQAFFILTGYTSSFGRSAGSFLMAQVKGLLLPWLGFSVLFPLLDWAVGNTARFDLFVQVSGQSYFFLVESYGFLMELFLAKTAYYLVSRTVRHEATRCAIFLNLMLAGFGIIGHQASSGIDNPYHYCNYFHYKDFLCMAWCLYLGTLLRRCSQQRFMWLCQVSALLYVGYVGILLAASYVCHAPLLSQYLVTFAHYTNYTSPFQLLPYVFVSATGSLGLFYLAQRVGQCRVIEYLGRNSLIIYCGHFFLLDSSIRLLSHYLHPVSYPSAILFFSSASLLTLAACYPLITLLKKARPACSAAKTSP